MKPILQEIRHYVAARVLISLALILGECRRRGQRSWIAEHQAMDAFGFCDFGAAA
jgi:hypothetical protein